MLSISSELKLCKLEPGEYKTPDNRFWIRDTYYPGGMISRKQYRWRIEDKSGSKPFQLLKSNVATKRVDTLTEAKEVIGLVYQREAEEKQLLARGYSKRENIQAPGICWLSPYTGQLITQSQALLEGTMSQ